MNNYKRHNVYLAENIKAEVPLYDRANVYCGCYKLKVFLSKMAEKCNLDMEKYAEINEVSGRFYIFSVQINLNGIPTEEGVQVSPFFYSVLCMMKAAGINIHIMQEDVLKLNEDINEILKQNAFQMSDFRDMDYIKWILFDKLGILSEKDIGLEGSSERIFACKGLKEGEETSDFNSFYLDEIEYVHKHYKENSLVTKYVTSLACNEQNKIMIDSDINAIQRWLAVDKFPLAKYPSKFAPTLMQQVAINIGISERDRKEKVFSVNGPPGTGKTTLLKEIIASNIEKLAEILIRYGIRNNCFETKEIPSASSPSYTEKYYTIPDRRCIEPMFSISNLISYDNRMFNMTNKKEEYLKEEQPFLLKKSGWIDVVGPENGRKNHFVKNQAEKVCQLLGQAVEIYDNLFERDECIFIITPFRTVAESMRSFVNDYFRNKGYDRDCLISWTKKCIGTVHTFQGKGANEVLFVLGCSKMSVGAMNWVVKKANILNVAVTRAKYRIGFIGDMQDWKKLKYFREFIPYLIDEIQVDDGSCLFTS